MINIEKRLQESIEYYWKTRTKQKSRQGKLSGNLDQGNRGAVTGGAQIDGFIN